MSENTLKACLLGLMGVAIVALTTCVVTGHDSAVTDGLLAITGSVGGIGIWERLKR